MSGGVPSLAPKRSRSPDESPTFCKADIRSGCADDEDALHNAIRFNNQPTIDLLLANHADVNAIDKSGQSPVMAAAAVNETESLRKLLDAGALVNLSSRATRTTALHIAINRGNQTAAELLLSHNANVNAVDERRESPLMATMSSNPYLFNQYAFVPPTEKIRLLLRFGADVNHRCNIQGGFGSSSYVQTALNSAILSGDVGAYQELLNAGADIDDFNLIRATHRTRLHVVMLKLLEAEGIILV